MGQIFSCAPCNKNKKDNEPLDFNIGVEVKEEKYIKNCSDDESVIDIKPDPLNEEKVVTSSGGIENAKVDNNIKNAKDAEKSVKSVVVESADSKQTISALEEDKPKSIAETMEMKNNGVSNAAKTFVEEGNKDKTMAHDISTIKDNNTMEKTIGLENVTNEALNVKQTSKQVEKVVKSKNEKADESLEKNLPVGIQENKTKQTIDPSLVNNSVCSENDKTDTKLEQNEGVSPNFQESMLIKEDTRKDENAKKVSASNNLKNKQDENLRLTDDINQKHSSISQPVAHSALKTDMKVFPTKDEKVINMN